MLCEYGCGQEARFILKNGRNICSESANKCPENKRKNSENSGNKYFKVRAVAIERTCQHCEKKITATSMHSHEKNCYLNPINLKICPVCKEPIKNFRTSVTCSSGCANTFFRSGKDHPNWKDETASYRDICFKYHKKECIICGEDNIVAVHHYDCNHNNDNPKNLIPLCPTHHTYMHSGFKDLILKQVDFYFNNFLMETI